METYLPYNPNATQKKYESAQITNSLITLRHIPKEGSIVINNFTESSSANPAQGYFFCNYSADTFYRDANRTLIFNAADNNKTVSIEYIAVGTPFTAQDANEIKSHLENNSIHGNGYYKYRGTMNPFEVDGNFVPASIKSGDIYGDTNEYFTGEEYLCAWHEPNYFHSGDGVPGYWEPISAPALRLTRYGAGDNWRFLGEVYPNSDVINEIRAGSEDYSAVDGAPYYMQIAEGPSFPEQNCIRIDTPDDLEDQLQALTDRIAALENSSPSLQKKTKTLTLTEHFPPDNNDETDWDFYTQADLRSRYNDPSRIDPAQVILPASIQNWRILTYPGFVELDSSNPAVIDEICIGQFLDEQIDQDKLAERDFFWENGFDGLNGYGFLESGTEYRSDDSEFVRFVINPEVFQFLMPFQSQIVVEYEELT